MAQRFTDLRAKMSPEDRRKSEERAAAMLMALDLAELRGSLDVTQEELAARLQISQSNVSRLEKRRDMLVSTLREVIEAFGGQLRLVADFPEGSIEIGQFDEDGGEGRLRRLQALAEARPDYLDRSLQEAALAEASHTDPMEEELVIVRAEEAEDGEATTRDVPLKQAEVDLQDEFAPT